MFSTIPGGQAQPITTHGVATSWSSTWHVAQVLRLWVLGLSLRVQDPNNRALGPKPIFLVFGP